MHGREEYLGFSVHFKKIIKKMRCIGTKEENIRINESKSFYVHYCSKGRIPSLEHPSPVAIRIPSALDLKNELIHFHRRANSMCRFAKMLFTSYFSQPLGPAHVPSTMDLKYTHGKKSFLR